MMQVSNDAGSKINYRFVAVITAGENTIPISREENGGVRPLAVMYLAAKERADDA